MRIFFFGDIHGNPYALDACLAAIDTLGIDKVYCMGDLVGWLPFGDRTLSRMRALDFPTVAGNHDLMVAGIFIDHREQIDRMQATAYNAGLLSTVPGAVDYLSSLPLSMKDEEVTIVHHSPFHLPDPGNAPTILNFDYLDKPALTRVLTKWKAYPGRLILSGHDHVPIIYELPDAIDLPEIEDVRTYRPSLKNTMVLLRPDCRYWVKAGSVGGPYRDGIPVANGIVYDRDWETLTFVRVPFQVDRLRRALASNSYFSNLPTIRKYIELLG